ncbi:hypothetical protein [Hyphomicrobium sp.]|uniref:hypothetical protein n=1 Tax=Hyphomicrobium sp. TaxID=82 RepID=UPI001D883292|nr:hypothetical protein [Hyphomicrobium sp.]MBY0560047.1 hypothetical protein [Hyphomicrobium sp.]
MQTSSFSALRAPVSPVAMAPVDLKKLARTNPRNFAAMDASTVLCMAAREFSRMFGSKEEAVAQLKTLPVVRQHALDKSLAKADAKRLGLIRN